MRSLRTFLLIFVGTGVPFGAIAALVTGLALGSMTAGLAAGAGAGLVFGGVMAVALSSIDAVTDRAPRGARRGPRQELRVAVRSGPDLQDRILTALRALPAEIHEADVVAGRYRARTATTWKSFGEEVAVQLTGDPAAPEAVVSSRPVVATTLVDYGKGRSNVTAVAQALGSRLPPGVLHAPRADDEA